MQSDTVRRLESGGEFLDLLGLAVAVPVPQPLDDSGTFRNHKDIALGRHRQ